MSPGRTLKLDIDGFLGPFGTFAPPHVTPRSSMSLWCAPSPSQSFAASSQDGLYHMAKEYCFNNGRILSKVLSSSCCTSYMTVIGGDTAPW